MLHIERVKHHRKTPARWAALAIYYEVQDSGFFWVVTPDSCRFSHINPALVGRE